MYRFSIGTFTMAFSSLYSAVCRGKWFLRFQDVDANIPLVEKLLERSMSAEDSSTLSERKPLAYTYYHKGAKSKSGNRFADAPKGSSAIIPVHGTLLKYGTMCSYGTTEYADMVREAVDSNNISSVILDIDSGGGSVDAIAPMLDAISYARTSGKSVVAYCDLCASAAYYIACYCDEIIASNEVSSEFGSIGVMMSFMDYAKYYENAGVKLHTVYSNLSDYKNLPFEMAKKGEYDKIRDEELDPLAKEFQEAVKSHRTNLKADTEGILRGRMFYARRAVEVGLADSVGSLAYAVDRAGQINTQAIVNEYIHSKS